MKKQFKLLTALAVMVAMTSCYKDLSTEATISIPDIEIKTLNVPDTLDILYGDIIKISPEVKKKGVSDPDAFTYDWKIDFHAGSAKDRLEISNTRELEYKANNTPSSEPYILSLEVVEKATGMGKIVYWPVYISNSIGEGLMVAYTKDGGLSSEIDFVSASPITYGYKGKNEHYVRELLKTSLGEEGFNEKINDMIFQASSGGGVYVNNYFDIGTDEHFYQLDPLTFEIKRRDGEIFNIFQEDSFKTTKFYHASGYHTLAIVNNAIYDCTDHIESNFNKLQYRKNIFSEKNVATCGISQGRLAIYEHEAGKILAVNAAILQGGMPGQAIWNPINFDLTGATPITCGPMLIKNSENEYYSGFVIKSAGGDYYLAMFDPLTTNTGGCYLLSAPEIENAESFAFCDGCGIFFYATSEDVYSTVVNGNTATTRRVAWAPDSADEKITGIQQYLQGWYGTHNYFDYEFTLPTHKLQMIITTYNEKTKEGKVYLRPYNVSTGMFTMKANGCYTFPGEILSIAASIK